MTHVPIGGAVRAVTGTHVVGATVFSTAMTWQAPVGSVVLPSRRSSARPGSAKMPIASA